MLGGGGECGWNKVVDVTVVATVAAVLVVDGGRQW